MSTKLIDTAREIYLKKYNLNLEDKNDHNNYDQEKQDEEMYSNYINAPNYASEEEKYSRVPQNLENLPTAPYKVYAEMGKPDIKVYNENIIDTKSFKGTTMSGNSSSLSAKSRNVSKIPDSKILSSTTNWEPLNLKDVDEEYHLYGLASVHIYYDSKTDSVSYNLLEPELDNAEKDALSKLKRGFVYVFEKFSPEYEVYKDEEIVARGTQTLLNKYKIKLSKESTEKIIYFLRRDFLGLEIVEPIMHDPFIEDVSCDGLNTPLFVNHLKYGALEVNRLFSSTDTLNSFIIKLAQKSSQEISLAKPILQGSLKDGSRVEAIYGKEISAKGSSFTIRKFREEPFTPIHLLKLGTMPSLLLAYLWIAVENKQSILVSGGTATGKTTILNALSLFVPPTSKIVSIEDTPEINLPHEHWLPMISRENEGKAQITMFDLLKASLRERPDYIIVGEIRGQEANILFQGMATGHAGLGTVHAQKFGDLVNRMTIEPINLPKPLITELDIIIFQQSVKIGNSMVRRTSSVVEIIEYLQQSDDYNINEFMKFKQAKDEFEFSDQSAVLNNLLEKKGGSEEDLWNEIERRKRTLDLMYEYNILEFKYVTKIIRYYYKNPSKIFDYIRELKQDVED